MTQGKFAAPPQNCANLQGAVHQSRIQAFLTPVPDRPQWGRQQSIAMDQRHEQFMQSLRN